MKTQLIKIKYNILNWLSAMWYVLYPIYFIIKFIVYNIVYKTANRIYKWLAIPSKDLCYILVILTLLISFYLVSEIRAFNESYEQYEPIVVKQIKTTQKGNFELQEGHQSLNSEQVKKQIKQIAEKENFPYVDYLIRLAACESRFNPEALGDNGNSRGLFQIHKGYHPTVTDEQAYNIQWATKWTMNKISSGYQRLWSCDKIIKGDFAYLAKINY